MAAGFRGSAPMGLQSECVAVEGPLLRFLSRRPQGKEESGT